MLWYISMVFGTKSEWRNRMLDHVYAMVYIDGLRYKVCGDVSGATLLCMESIV